MLPVESKLAVRSADRMRAYEEVVDFIAAGATPAQVANFCPSPAVKERVALLLSRHKDGSISPEEAAELEYVAQAEHLMRLTKARAHKQLR